MKIRKKRTISSSSIGLFYSAKRTPTNRVHGKEDSILTSCSFLCVDADLDYSTTHVTLAFVRARCSCPWIPLGLESDLTLRFCRPLLAPAGFMDWTIEPAAKT